MANYIVTIADVTGMFTASVESTLVAAVVTGRVDALMRTLVTSIEVVAVTSDSTTGGLVTVVCADLFVSMLLVTSL